MEPMSLAPRRRRKRRVAEGGKWELVDRWMSVAVGVVVEVGGYVICTATYIPAV